MAADEEVRRPLPPEPLECRQKAAALLLEDAFASPAVATAWALLAVAGELAEIRRELRRKR